MNPLYKVGDRVLVKSEYDPGYNEFDYLYCFPRNMLVKYGGRVCTISSSEYQNVFDGNKFPDDGYLYRIKEDNSTWSWASSMFEPEF